MMDSCMISSMHDGFSMHEFMHESWECMNPRIMHESWECMDSLMILGFMDSWIHA